MMRGYMVMGLLSLGLQQGMAQNDFNDDYEKFRQQAKSKYEDFRNKANRSYVEFVKKAWESYKALPAIPKPKEEEIPPVVIPKEDKAKPVENTPVKIDEDVVIPPVPEPQPKPIAPIREATKPQEQRVTFQLYGTDMNVRFNDDQRFRLGNCSETDVASAWEKLSGDNYNNTIRDCLALRMERQLSDWAYLQMLQAMAKACVGNGNEATLLAAFVYCQSGYKMRLGFADGKLCLLYASSHLIYGKTYFTIEGEKFYPLNSNLGRMNVCKAQFPQEKPLSLLIPQEQLLAHNMSERRTLVAEQYPEMKLTVCVNKNSLDFMNNYPSSMVDGNVMTRWAMYANKPLDKDIRDELYPALREKVKGLSQQEAMERLLNWVQTAFVYEYDNKVWGGDRAFFPEESLYYPYCDCEDRSILLSRIVRDVLGLKVILVYYPKHLAMAVGFTDEVKGDYIKIGKERFVVCDPTYIGAPVGVTMPDMDNQTAKVIILE